MERITEEQFDEIKRIASMLALDGYELLFRDDLSIEKLNRICNGIGPEWFPSGICRMMDMLHPTLKIVAIIHDLWYYYGYGSEEDFHEANHAFMRNGIIMAKYCHKWFSPRRYAVMFDSARLSFLCDTFGKFAYFSAIADRHADEREGM